MRRCSVKGCENKYRAKGYCATHWSQVDRRGRVTPHNRLSDNKVVVKEGYAEIILCDTLGRECGRAKVDLDYLDLAKSHKWYKSKNGYAVTRISKSKQIFLHHLILKPSEGMVIDHINGDGLDNRRHNLRECTHRQNSMNQKLRVDNRSGYKGVGWCSRKNRWRSRIQLGSREKHLGYYENIEDAIKVRKKAEEEHFGEFRRKDK